jgi:hypothetical protein
MNFGGNALIVPDHDLATYHIPYHNSIPKPLYIDKTLRIQLEWVFITPPSSTTLFMIKITKR